MIQSKRFAAAALLFSGLLSLTGLAVAQKHADTPAEKADEAALHDYLLTMPLLQKYAAAMKDFQSAAKDPGIQAESKLLEDNDKASMLEKVHQVETTCPHMNAWLKAHNLTAREFIMIPMTLMTTGIAEYAKEKGAKDVAYVNPANLAFYEQHKAEIDKLNIQAPSDDSQ